MNIVHKYTQFLKNTQVKIRHVNHISTSQKLTGSLLKNKALTYPHNAITLTVVINVTTSSIIAINFTTDNMTFSAIHFLSV